MTKISDEGMTNDERQMTKQTESQHERPVGRAVRRFGSVAIPVIWFSTFVIPSSFVLTLPFPAFRGIAWSFRFFAYSA